jgi:hypothetical protein
MYVVNSITYCKELTSHRFKVTRVRAKEREKEKARGEMEKARGKMENGADRIRVDILRILAVDRVHQ